MKERLTELLKGGLKYNDNPLSYCHDEHVGELADHLLENGVVVVDTNKVSVKNRPLITHIAGYPIDDVVDLMEVKNAGRIVELPCAVGDTVYWVTKSCDENGREESAIHEGTIISFSLQNDGLWFYCRYKYGLTFWHKIGYFGKTVFLTKEEAEAALKEQQ